MAGGTAKSGYLFSAANIPGLGIPAFDVKAQPSVHTSVSFISGTGSRSFFVSEAGVIFYNTTATAPTCTADTARTVSDLPLN